MPQQLVIEEAMQWLAAPVVEYADRVVLAVWSDKLTPHMLEREVKFTWSVNFKRTYATSRYLRLSIYHHMHVSFLKRLAKVIREFRQAARALIVLRLMGEGVL